MAGAYVDAGDSRFTLFGWPPWSLCRSKENPAIMQQIELNSTKSTKLCCRLTLIMGGR